jgi:hypothetical protein
MSVTPYSTGSLWKNLFIRIYKEKIPPSMLTGDLLTRGEKITLISTKAGLERKFDIKRTVLEIDDDEARRDDFMRKKRIQENFRKRIMKPTPEPEKRVELSESFEKSESDDSSEDVSEIEIKEHDSLYDKIQKNKYNNLKFYPSVHEKPKREDEKFQRSASGSSASSLLESKIDKRSAISNKQGKLFKNEPSSIARNMGPESEITSTIRGAFNQISTVVEAQAFRFSKRNKLNREISENVKNNININSELNSDPHNNLFKIVSHGVHDNYSPTNMEFHNTERRQLKNLKCKRGKSVVDHLGNPYQQLDNRNKIERTPSEFKKVEPIDVDLSGDSLRRLGFNKVISNPLETSRI